MKKFDTNRLFYKKYPYKLVLYTPLSNWFRGADLPYIRETLDELQQKYNQNNALVLKFWNREVNIRTSDLYYAQKVYSHLCADKSYRVRVEGRTLGIYSDDKDWLKTIRQDLSPIVQEWWEPKTLLQPNTIIMGSILQGWEYRVTVGSDVPSSFSRWVENNLDKIRIGPTFRDQLSKDRRYLSGFYFYVKNEKMLDLVTLVLGSSITRIDKIIIEDKNA